MRNKEITGKTRKKIKNRFILFLLPSLVGMLLFYIIPYIASYFYAFTDATTGAYVGFMNYKQMLMNESFRLAARNTLVFMLICVPLNIVVPFFLAYALQKNSRRDFFVLAFMLPLVIPSGATVYFWRVIFGSYGVINQLITNLGFEPIAFFQSGFTLFIVAMVFIFKNIGFNMVIFISGLGYIPNEYYEAAMVEGSTWWHSMTRITMIYITPTAFIVLLMSIINSFKIFREIYLLFGDYPHSSVYMMQHYMNNLFSGAVLQRLSAASTMISIIVAIIISLIYVGQRKLSKNL